MSNAAAAYEPTRITDEVGAVLAEAERRRDSSELTLDEVRYFYWETSIPVAEVAEAAGVSEPDLRLLAGPWPTGHACGWCGAPEFATSRTDLATRLRWWQTRDPGQELGWLPGDRCETCRAAFKRWYEISARNERLAREDELRELKTMPFRDYLRTEHWAEVRKGAMRRAGYRCQTCNSRDGISVHLRDFGRRGCERSSDVVVLCSGCLSRLLAE